VKLFAYILLIGLLVSCSAQKRLNGFLHRHPELAKDVTKTIIDTTTIITKDVRVDTIHSISGLRRDTLIINKENLTIRTFVYKDSIYVFGNCKSDTITVIDTLTVPVRQFIYQPKTILDKIKNWSWLFVLIGLILVLILYGFKWLKKHFL